MALKILHFSDIHARDNDLDEIEKCLDEIFQVASQEHPDLIACAGDVFDSQNVKLDSKSAKLIFKIFSDLADIAPVVVVIGTPSHDGTAAEVLEHIKAKHQVWVSSRPEQIRLVINDFCDGDTVLTRTGTGIAPVAIISMVPTPTKQFFNSASDIKGTDNEIAQAMGAMFAGFGAQAAEFPGIPHVLVYHGEVSGAKTSNGQTLMGQDIQVSLEQLNFSNADIHLLGHLHLPQSFYGKTFYSGSIHPVNWGEDHEHGFWIHELNEVE